MPYKDPEVRRRYDREYKQQLRNQRGLIKPGPTPWRKAYICFNRPHLRLWGIAFADGWFITDDPEKQATIEENELYGKEIFRCRVEPYLSGFRDRLSNLSNQWGGKEGQLMR